MLQLKKMLQLLKILIENDTQMHHITKVTTVEMNVT